MSVPPSTPHRFEVGSRPDVGVADPTPVVAAGRFDHTARDVEGSFAHAVYALARDDSDQARAFGALLRHCLEDRVELPSYDRVVLVPSHDGGTTAAMETVATELGPPYDQAIERTHAVTANKTIEDDDRRWANVAGSLAVAADVTDERVIVADDILGSGASLATAAATLRAAGATRVHGAVLGVRVPTPFELTPLEAEEWQRTS
ncbi:MAG: phosphoribosyltransferase family protein [Halobacteriaceae archaeon]